MRILYWGEREGFIERNSDRVVLFWMVHASVPWCYDSGGRDLAVTYATTAKPSSLDDSLHLCGKVWRGHLMSRIHHVNMKIR